MRKQNEKPTHILGETSIIYLPKHFEWRTEEPMKPILDEMPTFKLVDTGGNPTGWAYAITGWKDESPFPLYGQRDPRWKDVLLGFGTSTIGAYGCVVTSLAVLATAWSGRDVFPDEVNQRLKDVDGFVGTERNLVAWAKVPEALPWLKLDDRIDCRKVPAPINDIDQYALLAEEHPYDHCAIVCADFHPVAQAGVQTHYMPVVGGEAENGGYIINDSWHEQVLTLPPAYCSESEPTAARWIFVVVYFSKAEAL